MVENDSTWTVYELGLPKVYAIIPTIFTVMIIVNNILVMVTLSKVNRKSFQDIFIMALAAADLVTSLTMTVASGTFMTGYAVTTDEICALYAVSTVACVSTTTWLHSVICIEKCLSIVKPVWHKLFVEKRTAHHLMKTTLVITFIFPMVYFWVLVTSDVIKPTFTPLVAGCSIVIDWRSI